MSELNQAQVDRIKSEVNAKGGGKFKFLAAVSTNADRKLGVVTTFKDGEFHTASVGVDDNTNWLTNEEQFDNVVAKVVDAIGRG